MIRLIHWLQQILAVLGDKNKPIVVVGTHADKILQRNEDPNSKMQELIEMLKRNPELLSGGLGILLYRYHAK